MRRLTALILFVLSAPAMAEPLACANGLVTIAEDGPYATRMCETADYAIAEIAACNLPLTRPVEVHLTDTLEDNCVGVYHCGQGVIEVMHPDLLASQIADSSLFSALEVMDYFDSILFHELVHAAADEIPCPFGSCPATSEYLAYALQIRALTDEQRAAAGLDPNGAQISRDEINAIMVFWAPDRFAVKAWQHLMQRPDPCDYVGQIAQGNIRFDNEIHP